MCDLMEVPVRQSRHGMSVRPCTCNFTQCVNNFLRLIKVIVWPSSGLYKKWKKPRLYNDVVIVIILSFPLFLSWGWILVACVLLILFVSRIYLHFTGKIYYVFCLGWNKFLICIAGRWNTTAKRPIFEILCKCWATISMCTTVSQSARLSVKSAIETIQRVFIPIPRNRSLTRASLEDPQRFSICDNVNTRLCWRAVLTF